MNRRQKRALAKRIKGYKGLLSEASEKAMKQFEEMMQEKWRAETQVLNGEEPADAAKLDDILNQTEQKQEENQTKNAEEDEDGTNRNDKISK